MKKKSILFILFIISVNAGFCQTLFGLKAGLGVANVTLDKAYKESIAGDSENRIGYQAGLFMQKDIKTNLFMRTELVYAVKGYNLSSSNSGGNTTIGLNYVSLPLLLGYKLTPGISGFLGPEFSALGPVYASPEGHSDRFRLDAVVNYERLDIGIVAGGAYALTPKLSLDLRYIYGLSKIVKMDMYNEQGLPVGQISQKHNKALQLSLNYFFRAKI